MDWYDYLTPEFKLDRKAYRVNERYAFDCPKCGKSKVYRLNHIKRKIKDLGFYECSTCRKQDSISRARDAFKKKYGVKNPFQLKSVHDKIKKTNKERYGVDCILKKPEIRNKLAVENGVDNVSQLPEVKSKVRSTMLKKYGGYNLDNFRDLVNKSIRQKAAELRKKWKTENGKICGHCKQFKHLNEYSSIRYPSSKCKVCTNLYHNEYSLIRKSLLGYINNAESFLGCSIDEFTEYIESQFEPGMTWENWSKDGWHLDHIIPLSLIDESNKHIIHNYRNFRPLWAKDNHRKNNSLPKLYILTGCFGVGKSTVSNKLLDKFTVLDKDQKADIYDIGRSSLDKPVIYQTSMKVTNDINLLNQFFDTSVIVIKESIDEIETRIISRGGTFKKSTVERRIKRMNGIAKKYGTFSGTADECFKYLKNQLC